MCADAKWRPVAGTEVKLAWFWFIHCFTWNDFYQFTCMMETRLQLFLLTFLINNIAQMWNWIYATTANT